MPEERYAFERVLGEGAQGKVYLAYDRKLEKLTPERMLPLARALQQAMEVEA